MKDVIISINGTQEMEEGLESVNLVTDGKYAYDGSEGILTYMESEITGMDGTKTTFMVRPDLITLTREGSVNSYMTFERGRKHLFLYDTPYGSSTLGVDTRKLSAGMGENGGEMELEYVIDIDNQQIWKNAFKINVKEARSTGKA